MSHLRIFIAGHVIGLSDPERAANRAKMTNAAELLDDIGFDVVNPVELMDDQSDRNDVLCKYIRMMLDCTSVLLFDDDFRHEECAIASSTALIRHMGIMRENANLIFRDKVAPIIAGIAHIMGMSFADYAGVASRKTQVIQARAMFAHYCRVAGVQNRDIANCLHICGDTSAKTIGSKLNAQYDAFIATDAEFRSWDFDMTNQLTGRNNQPEL